MDGFGQDRHFHLISPCFLEPITPLPSPISTPILFTSPTINNIININIIINQMSEYTIAATVISQIATIPCITPILLMLSLHPFGLLQHLLDSSFFFI